MPFAEEFNDIYTDFIYVCLHEVGYDVERADDAKSQANILRDIIGGIVNSDLIVADLTGGNPNVYYEVGIAHALNKNVILIAKEITDKEKNNHPFDLQSYRVIHYSTNFKKMKQAKDKLFELASGAFNEILQFSNPYKDFGATNPEILSSETHNELQITEEDSGLFDYHVMLDDALKELNNIVKEVGDKLKCELTPETEIAAEKLKSHNLTLKQRRNIFIEFAGNLQAYGEFLKPKNEKYIMLLKNIDSSFENILSGNFELGNEEARLNLQNFIDSLPIFEKKAVEARQKFLTLIDTMESSPNFQKNFNRAKAFMTAELKTFADNIEQTISVVAKSGRLSSSLIKRAPSKKINSEN